MKNYWLYKLQVFLLAPIWLFKDKQNRVKYFLRLIVPDGPFVMASFYISELESGNYTNTNSMQYNNPWSMRMPSSTPVKVKQAPNGFAWYSSLSGAVYDYVHRQAVRFPTVMQKYMQDQQSFFVPAGQQTDYALTDAVKTAIVSIVYEMVATGWLGTNPPFNAANNYSNSVLLYADGENKDGKIETGMKRQRRGYTFCVVGYIAALGTILYFCLFYDKKKKKIFVPRTVGT